MEVGYLPFYRIYLHQIIFKRTRANEETQSHGILLTSGGNMMCQSVTSVTIGLENTVAVQPRLGQNVEFGLTVYGQCN